MAEKNIVILGASWAGLQSAHYFLKHIYPTLPKDGSTYKVVLISPSKKFYWRIAGPRLIVSKEIDQEKYMLDIPSHFTKYPTGSFSFVEGSATGLDTSARTVAYRVTESGVTESIPYHALIIATGSSTPLSSFNHEGSEDVVRTHWEDLKDKIWSAKSIIIGGGGPTGVESAGEIGSHLNGEPSFFGWLFGGANKTPKVPVTLVTSDKRILPVLRPALGQRAEGMLNALGVTVRYNSRIDNVSQEEKGPTTVTLTNGEKLVADLYIPALGIKPNTSAFPGSILNERGAINSVNTQRVPSAGPRVFAVGEVSGHLKRGGIMSILDQIAVAMTNLQRDLLAYTSATDEKANVAQGPDREFVENMAESQLVPIGRKKGVAAAFGWKLPTILVYYAKGMDYMTFQIPKVLGGDTVSKESKWTPAKAS